MSKILSVLLILFSLQPVYASTLFGHNISSTSYTLPKGDVTVGSYAVGYGLTDNLTLATSSFLYLFYNMNNAIVRYRNEISDTPVSLQLAYFKTDENLGEAYFMEALSASLTATVKQEYSSAIHLTANLMHFYDETRPFSLRREPLRDQAYQYSLSSLFETRLNKNWGLLNEVGVLGINYVYPQVIIGASLHRRWNNFIAQFGASVTGTPRAYFSERRVDAASVSEPEYLELAAKYDLSVHPEIQFQFYF